MTTSPTVNETDLLAQEALQAVKLDLLTAKPSPVRPFSSSTISWAVTLSDKFDIPVQILLDDTPVPTSGQVQVAPDLPQTYQLSAHAIRYSRILGSITLDIDFAACVTLTDAPVRFIAGMIEQQINTDTSGLYFRSTAPFP